MNGDWSIEASKNLIDLYTNATLHDSRKEYTLKRKCNGCDWMSRHKGPDLNSTHGFR